MNYFPLESDDRWEYDLEVSRADGSTQSLTAVKSVGGSEKMGEATYHRVVTVIKGGGLPVPDQLYRVGPDGVYAAVQGAEGKELLVLPADTRAGSTWKGEARPSITELDGEAVVGQGFEHGELKLAGCVKVTLKMSIPQRSLFGGQTDVPVRMERWFAPGVGMVREVRVVGEPGKPNYLKTDSKLTSYSGLDSP